MDVGAPELLIVAIVGLILFFGWKQLPEMSRSLGRSLRIFKTEMKGMKDDDAARKAVEPAPPATPQAPAAEPTPAAQPPASDAT